MANEKKKEFEIAETYAYTTKAFNQQVKNNEERFDEDFRFEFTREEVENSRTNFLTSSWGGSRYLPYVFTEQGTQNVLDTLEIRHELNEWKTKY